MNRKNSVHKSGVYDGTSVDAIKVKDWWVFLVMASCILVCLYIGTTIMYDKKLPSYYQLLPILPFSFAAYTIFFPILFKYAFLNLGVALVVGGYFVRNVLSPFIMMYGDYYGVFKMNLDTNMPKGICLMVYETFVVFLSVALYIKYFGYTRYKEKYQNMYINHSTNIRFISLVLGGLVAFCIFVAITIPGSRSSFTTIFDEDLASMMVDIDSIAVRGGLSRALVTLFQMCVGFLRYLIPTYFIVEIRRRVGEKTIGILLSLPFIGLQFFVIAETLAYSIFGALISIFLIVKIYPSKAKTFIVISGIVSVFGMSYFIFLKTVMLAGEEGASLASLSAIMQAYFPGCCNMAGVFNINNPNKWRTLFFDVYYCIPFRGTLFGLQEERLVSVYNSSNGVASNIIPAVGHAYHYLGALLAPIEPATMAYLGVKYGRKLKCQKSVWRYVAYAYLVISFSISPVMFNLSNLLSFITFTFVPMYLIISFEGKYNGINSGTIREGGYEEIGNTT